MKYCQHCGNEMKLEDRYCQNCGADSQVPVTQAADLTAEISDAKESMSGTESTQESEDKTSETVSTSQDSEEEIQAISPVIQESETASQDTSSTSQETVAPNQEEPIGTTQTASAFAQVAAATPLNTNGIETKFNWGAFVSPFSFGIAHKTYLGLLSLLAIIPIIGWIFGIVWAFVFGFNGEKWALENAANQYRDNEEFRKVMSPWHRYGLVAFIIAAVVIVLYLIIIIVMFSSLLHFNDYNY